VRLRASLHIRSRLGTGELGKGLVYPGVLCRDVNLCATSKQALHYDRQKDEASNTAELINRVARKSELRMWNEDGIERRRASAPPPLAN